MSRRRIDDIILGKTDAPYDSDSDSDSSAASMPDLLESGRLDAELSQEDGSAAEEGHVMPQQLARQRVQLFIQSAMPGVTSGDHPADPAVFPYTPIHVQSLIEQFIIFCFSRIQLKLNESSQENDELLESGDSEDSEEGRSRSFQLR